ncbi:MAG: YtxH domain-containing protein [Solitalea-like symbiont of Tyrophagus putrescentiae]
MCHHSGRHLFCIGLGVLIGVLIAPQKGKITRRDLATKFEDLVDTIKDKTNETINDAERKVKRIARKTSTKARKATRSTADAVKRITKQTNVSARACMYKK